MRPGAAISEKLSNLDLLRAVAVLCVLADHIAATFGVGRQYGFFDLGQLGVLFFFVHTSLVLMQSLDRQQNIRAFYLRRLFRIYPLSILAVCIACACHVPEAPWRPWHAPGPGAVVSSFFLVNNLTGTDPVIGPLWSLPLEVQMYVTLPFVYALVKQASKRRLALLWCASASLGAAQIYLAKTGHWGMWRFTVAAYAPCFLSGAITWSLLRQQRRRLPSAMWAAGIAVSGTGFLLWQIFGPSAERYPAYRGWICCLAIGLVLPFCRDFANRVVNRVAETVATYSYGIYLSQGVLLWLVFVCLRGWPIYAKVPLFVALMTGVPVLLFHAVERPAMSIGASLARRLSTRAPAAAAVNELAFTESLLALHEITPKRVEVATPAEPALGEKVHL